MSSLTTALAASCKKYWLRLLASSTRVLPKEAQYTKTPVFQSSEPTPLSVEAVAAYLLPISHISAIEAEAFCEPSKSKMGYRNVRDSGLMATYNPNASLAPDTLNWH